MADQENSASVHRTGSKEADEDKNKPGEESKATPDDSNQGSGEESAGRSDGNAPPEAETSASVSRSPEKSESPKDEASAPQTNDKAIMDESPEAPPDAKEKDKSPDLTPVPEPSKSEKAEEEKEAKKPQPGSGTGGEPHKEEKSEKAPDATTKRYKAVILGLHGVTVSVKLVEEFLRPYVKENIETYLRENWNDKSVQNDFHELIRYEGDHISKDVPRLERTGTRDAMQKSIAAFVRYHMDHPSKDNPCKRFERHMWFNCYVHNKIQTPFYEDVANTLKGLQKKKTFVYSFGAAKKEAQKLFYTSSKDGNLRKYISGFFDPSDMDKKKSDQWKKLVNKIQRSPGSCLYVTHTLEDAKAAKAAGLDVAIIKRPGNEDVGDTGGIPTGSSLEECGIKI